MSPVQGYTLCTLSTRGAVSDVASESSLHHLIHQRRSVIFRDPYWIPIPKRAVINTPYWSNSRVCSPSTLFTIHDKSDHLQSALLSLIQNRSDDIPLHETRNALSRPWPYLTLQPIEDGPITESREAQAPRPSQAERFLTCSSSLPQHIVIACNRLVSPRSNTIA